MAGCAVAICHVGSALAQGTMLQLRNTDLPRLSSFLYIYVCIYVYTYVCTYIYIFITTVPRSCGLETVGEVLPQKTYRPRIK